jgi:anti-anti-sigma factor
MDVAVGPLAPGVAKIVLDGRLDIARASAIDLQFNAVAGSHKAIVVDLAGVSFLASIGIRTLLLAAETVQRRGGTPILLNPGTEVERVLSVIGAAELMPIYRDTGAALAAALAHS